MENVVSIFAALIFVSPFLISSFSSQEKGGGGKDKERKINCVHDFLNNLVWSPVNVCENSLAELDVLPYSFSCVHFFQPFFSLTNDTIILRGQRRRKSSQHGAILAAAALPRKWINALHRLNERASERAYDVGRASILSRSLMDRTDLLLSPYYGENIIHIKEKRYNL